jgi:propionate catabolism operon transcriptional regulator
MNAQKIRILAVVPYEGLKRVLLSVCEGMADIELEVIVDHLESGIQITKNIFYKDIDLIMARRSTANLLAKTLPVPVVVIEVSGYDLLRVIKLSQNYSGRVALVGHPEITRGALTVCELLQVDIAAFEVEENQKVEPLIDRLLDERYSVIIGDTLTVAAAQKKGMYGILITSGKESVYKALDEARKLYRSIKQTHRELELLKQVITDNDSESIIYTAPDERFFSTLQGKELQEFNEILRPYCNSVFQGNHIHTVIDKGQQSYRINGSRVEHKGHCYAAFLIQKQYFADKTYLPGVLFQHHIGDKKLSLYLFCNKCAEMKRTLDLAREYSKMNSHIFIDGEYGSGKTSLARLIHLSSNRKYGMFIRADCTQITNHEWRFIMENQAKLFMENAPCTLYLMRVDCMPEEIQNLFLRHLDAGRYISACLIIASAPDNVETLLKNNKMNPILLKRLSKLRLHIPPLRERKIDIPDLASLVINETNTTAGKEMIALSEKAVELLQEYDWKGNFKQFQSILESLVITSKSPYIQESAVRLALQKDMRDAQLASTFLPKGKTLDELIRDIILSVLEESGGNQSQAARRLGVSRSTMCRKMKQLY